MRAHPEVEIVVLVRQMRATQGMATATGHVSLLTETPIDELIATVLKPAFLEALGRAGFQVVMPRGEACPTCGKAKDTNG